MILDKIGHTYIICIIYCNSLFVTKCMDQKEIIGKSAAKGLLYFLVRKHHLHQEQYLPCHLGAALNCFLKNKVICTLILMIFVSFIISRQGDKIWLIKNMSQGLPWWCSGWESACQCREHGFEPWSGKIPHATEQLGPWATTTEPAHLEPVLHNRRGHDSERPAHRVEEWPPLAATRESPRTETKTQHSQK